MFRSVVCQNDLHMNDRTEGFLQNSVKALHWCCCLFFKCILTPCLSHVKWYTQTWRSLWCQRKPHSSSNRPLCNISALSNSEAFGIFQRCTHVNTVTRTDLPLIKQKKKRQILWFLCCFQSVLAAWAFLQHGCLTAETRLTWLLKFSFIKIHPVLGGSHEHTHTYKGNYIITCLSWWHS